MMIIDIMFLHVWITDYTANRYRCNNMFMLTFTCIIEIYSMYFAVSIVRI